MTRRLPALDYLDRGAARMAELDALIAAEDAPPVSPHHDQKHGPRTIPGKVLNAAGNLCCPDCREVETRYGRRCPKCSKAHHRVTVKAWRRKHPNYQARYWKRNYKRKDEAGLCRNCSRPRVEGRKYCVKCAQHHRDGMSAAKRQRAADGMCPDCGKPPKEGFSRCATCLEKIRVAVKRSRAKKALGRRAA